MMNVRYLIALCCLFFSVENLKSADIIKNENDIESVRTLFPFKRLTDSQKELDLVPCEPGMHVGVYRRYWDTPMLQYFLKCVQNDDAILEIGCAIGALSYQLCDEKLNVNILAIDFNEFALSTALAEQKKRVSSGKKRYERIEFMHADFGKQFFFARTYNFDRISFFNVAHYMTPNQLNTAFCNIRNCLTENGVLYFSMVSMIAPVKEDLQFIQRYKKAVIHRNVHYPGYIYGSLNHKSGNACTYTYQFAENLNDIPFAYQAIEGKRSIFLGDKETIKRMMMLNGLKPIYMFYSSAKEEKHFESIADALKEASNFTLNIVAKLG